MLNFSIIVCTHNPRLDYLHRVLEAIKLQTLPKEQWELLLIDNGSTVPLTPIGDLSWHPRGRIIREDELGLTPARLRGIRESEGRLLVFVDDDNLLQSDYLAECLRISDGFPFLGDWGGQIIPEFEVSPDARFGPFLRYLLIRQFEEVKWVNTIDFYETTPSGAGMCLRRAVATEYESLLERDPRRKELDRKGDLIFAGGDTDMALCARRLGLGMGLFPTLKLMHLIPEIRLKKAFLVRAAFGSGYTITLLNYLYGISTVARQEGVFRRGMRFARLLALPRLERRLSSETEKGVAAALERIAAWERPTMSGR